MSTRYSVRKKNNPIKLFLITLITVLALGAVVIMCVCLPHFLENHKDDEFSVALFIESIPETFVDEEVTPEVLGANKSKYANELSNAEYMRNNRIFAKEGTYSDCVTIGFTGDILFDDEYAVTATLKQRGGDLTSAISPETLAEMNAMDIMVVNNEFPYTERGIRTEGKQYTFRADYDTVGYLNRMGADVAILANNHVLDFGQEGLADTITTLNSAGVVPLGAGANISEAAHPVYFIVNDIKIALVAATQIERNDNPNTIGATETSGGTFRCWTGDLIYQKVAEAKQNADFVIACIHWGTEKEMTPDCYQLSMAPLLAQAGADVIIGDHPHVLQGITYFNDTPCIYSLGNFWFNSSTLESCMVELTVDANGLRNFRFVPAMQKGCTTSLATGSEAEQVLRTMRNLSPGVTIDENGFVFKK